VRSEAGVVRIKQTSERMLRPKAQVRANTSQAAFANDGEFPHHQYEKILILETELHSQNQMIVLPDLKKYATGITFEP